MRNCYWETTSDSISVWLQEKIYFLCVFSSFSKDTFHDNCNNFTTLYDIQP